MALFLQIRVTQLRPPNVNQRDLRSRLSPESHFTSHFLLARYGQNWLCSCVFDLRQTPSIHIGVRRPHLRRLRPRHLDLNQRPLPHSRTVLARRLLPRATALHQFRPERKDAALGRLGRMNSAALAIQEVAVSITRNPEANPITRAEDELALELLWVHTEKCRGSHDIVLGEVHEAPLPATFRTARLAFKSQSFGHCHIIICYRADIYDILPPSQRGGVHVPSPRYRTLSRSLQR
jgi:hypothetical protein